MMSHRRARTGNNNKGISTSEELGVPLGTISSNDDNKYQHAYAPGIMMKIDAYITTIMTTWMGLGNMNVDANKVRRNLLISMACSCLLGVAITIGILQVMNYSTNNNHNNKNHIQLFPDSCAALASAETEFADWYEHGTFAKMQTIDAFYNNAQWPPRERISASGPGSDLGIATNSSLDFLRKIIRDQNVRTMIDLPCGDVNWIFDAWELDSLDLYIGLDVVKPLVELDQRRFAFHSNKVFLHWDGISCPLPKFRFKKTTTINTNFLLRQKPQPVDLIHSRDVIQHLGLQEGIAFLCNVFQSGSRLFVTTTYPNGENRDIKSGDHFLNNLATPPYDLPMPKNPSKNCILSHPTIEPDLTCLYNLTEPWVQPWIQQKCTGGRPTVQVVKKT